ncbi:type VI secretion system baseplate subunit TssE [Acetobacter okinawensis]|uniref:type VI secretion system baseplate subunit TssE n=1 Tax=Acetobacteraceae TaxID=433 RepID=UPI0006873A2B|nr:type VI secretion system baseplate subunit TssE [Acetobacter okinawensis]MBS0964511.1 type VI secretion system baseplate subunit TssE [Acetobacter okinawensis]MBS0987592.1 type VI secretion system baseplate subunit TssE [Acetobacter okinawensis]MCP1214082.1 type VI secretion system baseplate subunit TssE [Acetobacter okinawensis]
MNDATINQPANANIFLERMRDAGARVKLSVLDRLIDTSPDNERDRPMSATEALSVLRTAVRRDLEALLNGHRRFRSIPQRYAALRASNLGFGLPDFAASARNAQDAREELRREIETTIRTFEPRLIQVSVLVQPSDEHGALVTLRFRIEALLHADPAPEPISFDTSVDAATANIVISGGQVG